MRPVLVSLATVVVGCSPAPEVVAGEPGTPLPALDEAELDRFRRGLTLFNRVFTPEEGLGPAFNENQCSACHTTPAAGGSAGLERITKATRHGGPGACDPLSAQGGENVRKQATPLLAAHGTSPGSVPEDATEVVRLTAPFLFGLGLVEAIPEDVIAAGADPDDADGDGISGRAARGPDGRLTRFGHKADHATIESFTRGALLFEMGLTSRADDLDHVGGAPAPAGTDPVPEPEVDAETLDLLVAFTRYLAPPAPTPARSSQHADTLAAGRRLFEEAGCTGCHTPAMRTDFSDTPALSRKTVELYSDLLLHDMGPRLASVCGYDASTTEHRTALLMGLQHRDRYLHDGRAGDLREAVLAHDGEARAAREAFGAMSWLEQELVVMFLGSL